MKCLPLHANDIFKMRDRFLVEKHVSETQNVLLADYWSESDQDDIDGSLTLKQEGSATLCDTYHRTPSVSYKYCF